MTTVSLLKKTGTKMTSVKKSHCRYTALRWTGISIYFTKIIIAKYNYSIAP